MTGKRIIYISPIGARFAGVVVDEDAAFVYVRLDGQTQGWQMRVRRELAKLVEA